MRLLLLMLVSLLALCAGCVAPGSNYGYGGYGAAPTYGGGYAAPAQTPAVYQQPMFSPFPQTIPPPATGTIGYGPNYYPTQGYAAPGAAPYPSGSVPSNGWQSTTPAPNSGAGNSPQRRPQPLPRGLRRSDQLAWQSPGTAGGSNLVPVTYDAPIHSQLAVNQPYYPPINNAPASSPLPAATADCGCNGSVAQVGATLTPQAAPNAAPATYYQPTRQAASSPSSYAPVSGTNWR